MKELEEVIELLHNTEVTSNHYLVSRANIDYEMTWTKGLPRKIAKVTKIDRLFETAQYKVHFRKKVDFKRLNEICKDKGYRGEITESKENFRIGRYGEIFAREEFISFIPEKKKKALDIINAYLEQK